MSNLVSILIPAYNAAPWIEETLTSAISQTYPNKEIIVVDDGSSDNTLEIARAFSSKAVNVITQPNKGAAAARNTALRAAQGSYVQFLDADDLLDPNKIAAQLYQVEGGHHSLALLTCAWGRFFVYPERAKFVADFLWRDLSPVDWLITKFTNNAFMIPAAWLVSRRLIEEAGPWNEDRSPDDDGEYMCRLVAASQSVRFVPQAKCYYRIGNAGSLSAQKSDVAVRAEFGSKLLCIQHLLALEDSGRTRRACVRLLQENLQHYYPERGDLVEQSRSLAQSLGGELMPPRERIHFKLVRRVLGWRTAKRLRGALNDTKLRVRKTIDKLPLTDAQFR